MSISQQFLLVSVIILLDQATKFLARIYNFSHVFYNQGISFGFLGDNSFTTWVILILILFALLLLFKKSKSSLVQFSLLLILAGGISNFLDRIFFGAVIDFIKIGPFPVFNLADGTITGGVILIIYDIYATSKNHLRR